MYTPQGTFKKKMCFWINKQYLQEKLINPIYLNKSEK